MPDQPIDKLKPDGKIAKNLVASGDPEPNHPGTDANKERRLRDLLCGGDWTDLDIGLIIWDDASKSWMKWDRA